MGTGTRLALTTIGVVALGLAGWWATTARAPLELESASGVARLSGATEEAASTAKIASGPASTAPRRPLRTTPPPEAEARSGGSGPDLLRGRTVTAAGAAVSGIEMGIWPDLDRRGEPHDASTTNSNGGFELDALANGWIDVLTSGWTLLYHPAVARRDGGRRAPIELIAQPAVDGPGIVGRGSPTTVDRGSSRSPKPRSWCAS